MKLIANVLYAQCCLEILGTYIIGGVGTDKYRRQSTSKHSNPVRSPAQMPQIWSHSDVVDQSEVVELRFLDDAAFDLEVEVASW